MEAIIPYAVWASVIITALGLLSIAIFGLRNLAYGKISTTTIAITAIPLVLWAVLGLVMGDWVRASVLTAIITAGLALVALLFSGLRGLVG